MKEGAHKDMAVELRMALNHLVGQICWGVIAGKGTGSRVDLNFGKKIPRRSPLGNPHLTDELRQYEGEIGIYIECVWRIDSEIEVICGCWEDNSKGGPMLRGLQRLVGHKVESIDVSLPAFDIALRFSNSLVLRVFCDQTNLTEAAGNYSIFLPEMIYIVDTRSKLRKEFRKSIAIRN